MPENHVKNEKFGLYRSLCCGREIVIGEGFSFPDCPNHPNLTTVWKPVTAEIVELKPMLKTSNYDAGG
jgi:hypothetical protein